MGFFREKNEDDFDRECAEADFREEAWEARAYSRAISPEKAARIDAELAEAERRNKEREAAAEAERLAWQREANAIERAAHAYVRALSFGVADPRDLTPEPPAYLDPHAVLKMRRMVKDASENGDRPWPYTRDAA